MPCDRSPLHLLLADKQREARHLRWGKKPKGDEGSGEKPPSLGRSILWGAVRDAHRIQLLRDAAARFSDRNGNVWGIDTSMDLTLELYTDNGGIKVPYERRKSFEFCKIDVWYDPSCNPGIMSFLWLHKEPYVIIYGNDQYVRVHPDPQLIDENHPLREVVVKHFEVRGLTHLSDSWAGTDKWERYNGQANRRTIIGSDREDGGESGDDQIDRPVWNERDPFDGLPYFGHAHRSSKPTWTKEIKKFHS